MSEREVIDAAAAEWLVRLQSRDLSWEDTLAWQRWMGADARHAEAFERIETVWEQPWEAMETSDGAVRPGRAWSMAAGVAILALGAASVVWQQSRATEVLSTQIGETRSIRLIDGSQVTLGGHTRLQVELAQRARRLELKQGEVFFKVAQDHGRPFTVRAGDALIQAVGTEFNVRRGSDRVVVAVVEGRVLVQPPAAETLRPLDSGRELIVDKDGSEPKERPVDAMAATAWQTGRLVFRAEPLRYAVEDVNRYSDKPIVLADEDLGALKITGTVVGARVHGWIASLEDAFPLTAIESRDRIVLKQVRRMRASTTESSGTAIRLRATGSEGIARGSRLAGGQP